MKSLHRKDLFGWSVFNENLDIDFNSVLWTRDGGNILVDPLPMTSHDQEHLAKLGGAAWIVVTNSDHIRASREIAAQTGAKLVGPAGEEATMTLRCDRWLIDGEELVPGLVAVAMAGSKTPGELALLLDGSTLITGDLIRAHRAGRMMMLPEPKTKDRVKAIASIARVAEMGEIEAILVGDGWPVFHAGRERLLELVDHLNG